MIRIDAKDGSYLQLLEYGAAIQKLVIPDRDGRHLDVVLGYDTVSDYQQYDGYFGAVIGRCANRIRNASFILGGKQIQLIANEGKNSLHGGMHSFDAKIWSVSRSDQSVCFQLCSPDGEAGYPGNLEFSVRYTFNNSHQLIIEYEAVSDQDTLLNPTNHAYFNLSGHQYNRLDGHLVEVLAETVLENDEETLPTGKQIPVSSTVYDFRTPATLAVGLVQPHSNMLACKGYDHNYCLNGSGFRRIGSAASEISGISMQIFSSMPGLQLYTGNNITPRRGKDGIEYHQYSGVCFETQYFPDAIHHPQFLQPILTAGKRFYSRTEYHFSPL